jgi:ATP-binding cassette subfamily C protein CydC
MVAVVGVRAFALGRAAFRYLQRLLLHDAVFTHLATLRPQIFAKLVELTPQKRFGSRGESISALTTDVDELQNLGLRVIAPMIQAGTAIVAALTILLVSFPESGLGVLAAALISLAAIFALTKAAAKNSEQTKSELRNELRSQLVEHIENVELIVGLGWQSRYRSQIQRLSTELRTAERRGALTSGMASAALGLFAILTVYVSAALASYGLDRGVEGNLLAVAVLLPLAVFDVFATFQLAATAQVKHQAAKKRLQALMSVQPGRELAIVDGAEALESVAELRLANASLQIDGHLVHQGLDLGLISGQVKVLTGPSGSGKTTIALALSSLISPVAGDLFFDGSGAEQFSLEAKRARVVLIEQEPHVFAGTVRQNLEISGANDESSLRQALEDVGLWVELEARGGLDAELSESAANVSAGQAQRLAIARALLADASFILLDEPTSGLDWDNSARFVETIKKLAGRGKGILVITHDQQLAEMFEDRVRIG